MVEDFQKYLKQRHFDKTLRRHIKKFEGKKIVVYGTGMLFEAVVNNYDLSKLNIIAVADRKYAAKKPDKYLGFDTVAPDDIADLKPDVVLVGVLRTVAIVEYLRYDLLLDKGIQVYPLVDRKILEILKEIWA